MSIAEYLVHNVYGFHDDKFIRMMVNGRKSCSCYICSTRRKWKGPTKQEIEANMAMEEELGEINR